MNRPAHERDATLTALETEVIETGSEGDRPFAITADTIFYPEGGGQPADHGTMGGIDVVDVQKTDRVVRHFLSGELPLGPILKVLDWDRPGERPIRISLLPQRISILLPANNLQVINLQRGFRHPLESY